MSGQPDLSITDIRVVGGNPSAEELAALVAVVTESYRGEAATAVIPEDPRVPEWVASSRALRAPLRRDLGWAGFHG